MEEAKNREKKMDMTSTDPENYKKLLKDTKISKSDNFLQKSEYRDKYDGTRLYNRQGPSKVYVSKRAGDESDFWAQGKFCYDDPILRKELLYFTKSWIHIVLDFDHFLYKKKAIFPADSPGYTEI